MNNLIVITFLTLFLSISSLLSQNFSTDASDSFKIKYYQALGELNAESPNAKKAAQLLSEALAGDSTNLKIREKRGVAYALYYEWKDAINDLKQVLAVYKDNSEANLYMGISLLRSTSDYDGLLDGINYFYIGLKYLSINDSLTQADRLDYLLNDDQTEENIKQILIKSEDKKILTEHFKDFIKQHTAEQTAINNVLNSTFRSLLYSFYNDFSDQICINLNGLGSLSADNTSFNLESAIEYEFGRNIIELGGLINLSNSNLISKSYTNSLSGNFSDTSISSVGAECSWKYMLNTFGKFKFFAITSLSYTFITFNGNYNDEIVYNSKEEILSLALGLGLNVFEFSRLNFRIYAAPSLNFINGNFQFSYSKITPSNNSFTEFGCNFGINISYSIYKF